MTNSLITDRDHTSEIMSRIGDRYLLLIRENYLDDPAGAALREHLLESLRELMNTGRFSCIYNLSCSSEWREAVVGLHYSLLLACRPSEFTRPGKPPRKVFSEIANQVADKMECELRDNPVFPQSLAARPALLLLTALDRLPAVQAYLNSDPPIEDSFEFDAASLAVPIAKVPEEPAREHPLLARYRAEAWFDERDFSHSQLRFIRAYRFWTDGSSSDRN